MHRLVIGLVALLGLAGAAFVAGYLLLFAASTDRAAALAPANSAVYVNVYLQPSAGQRMNLAELIGRLPGFADEATLDEKVDQVVQNLLAGTGIDYREGLKPWLGTQVAVAAWADEAGPTEPTMVAIIDLKDREAAEAAVADLAEEAGSTFTSESYEGVELQVAEGTAYAFVGEMLVVSDAAAPIQAVVDVEGGAASLGERTDFRAAMADLPADHIATAFVDLGALAASGGVEDQLDEVTTAAAALVAEPDGLRLSGSAPFDTAAPDASPSAGVALGGEPSTLVDWMPADTVAEVVVFGLRQTLEDAEAAARTTPEGEELGDALDTFRAIAAFGLGIDIDDDLLPLLDREVGVALGSLDGPLPGGQLLLRPSDPEAAAESLGRIIDGLEGGGGEVRTESAGGSEITILGLPDLGELAYTIVDGTVIIGLGADDVMASIEAHESGETLGATPLYERAFDVAGERAGTEGFVDVGALLELVEEDDALPSDARDILQQVGAFAFTAPSRDDQIEFHAVVTIEEATPE